MGRRLKNKILVMSNMDINDQVFSNDIGSWNVTRALRDCLAGKHKVYSIDIAEAYAANAGVEVEEAKVERFMALERVLEIPLLGIIDGGPLWLIDGHHRLRALHRLGRKECAAYIIEEAEGAPYVIWYNGKRLLAEAK